MSSKNDFINAMENWANIYLFRSLSHYFDFLRSSHVSMQQAYALTFIHYQGPSNISKICEHMMVSAAAASQMVDRLEKQNLAKRKTASGDRRVHNVMLTESGVNFVKASITARENWIKDIPAHLSDHQLDQIVFALQQLTSAYQK